MESSAEISFFQAKNGSQVCSCKNINLHSAYNPEKEGDRFAETIAESFFPSAILVTEPALSYCKEGLHKKYPDAKLTCIRYSKKFSSTDKEWNKVFYFSNETELENELFDFFGEEGILSCIFLSWQPSANVFPETNQKAWSAIKNAVTKSTAVLSTRKYFAGRWLKNSVKFFSRVENISVIKKGSSPVIIAASGRSLNSSLPFLKKNRNKFFLIAVSSAIQPLLFNGITPDLCLSTDGGFWAKKHLEILLKPEHADIPLALTSEANCPSKILTSAPIIPLSYHDFPETDFFENLGIKIMASPEKTAQLIKSTGFGFLMAPVYHAAMRFAAPIRKALGIKTIFNILGPLLNPANAEYEVLGVYSMDLMQDYARAAKSLGAKRVMVIASEDGYDEISPCADTSVYQINSDGKEYRYTIHPSDFGITDADENELIGGDGAENASIALEILNGKGRKTIRYAVGLNAAAVLYISGKVRTLKDGYKTALEAIDSGKALAKLEEIKQFYSNL